jgi:hypothetical protein
MSRAWPFEDTPEGGRLAHPVRTPQEFVAEAGEGAEAVVVRIGLNDAQLVVIDAEGAWDRWVYHSLDEATKIAGQLGLEVHVGEFPEALRVRLNVRRRPAEEFEAGAYPEQGRVGPVIPYPENRPRRIESRPDARKSSGS